MNGVLVLDKPEGFTSFDAVAVVRGISGQRRVGHGGTLDPMATGVLPVFVGSATKAADLDPDRRKCYLARVQTGVKTDTGDITGRELCRREPLRDPEPLLAAIPRFLGEQQQLPPMYSAVSVGGKRLYQLAREGRVVQRSLRTIFVDSISLLDFSPGDGSLTLEVRCRKGTYIRTLAEDLLEAAGSCGALSALRRTRSGGFTLEEAVSLEQLRKAGREGLAGLLQPVERVFMSLPAVPLSPDNARRFLNGVPVKYLQGLPEGPLRVLEQGRFLGLGEMRGGELVKIRQFV